MNEYAAALDFGSDKIALAVGEKTSSGIRIVSYHDAPSSGIECGEINNDSKVEEIVRSLVEQAEADISEKLSEITVGLSGRILHSKKVSCNPKRKNPKHTIDQEEVRQIIRTQYQITGDGEIVFEVSPQRYSTEDRIGITEGELLGMQGAQLEADFLLFTGRNAILDRRLAVLNNCGHHLHKAILSPIASSRAVLSRNEMENGVALVDIGKGTTEVAIIKDSVLRYTTIIPFGGESITSDIKTVTGITRQWAEILKVEHGRCCEEYAIENRKLILKDENNVVEGEVEMTLLARIIEARMSEILDAVRYVIEQSGYAARIPAGVVITGGTSHIENIIQLAGAILGRRIRLAAPQGSITNDSVEAAFDVYASTVVGLVLETIEPMLSHALERTLEPKVIAEPASEPRLQPEEPKSASKKPRRGLFGVHKKEQNGGEPDLFTQLFGFSNDNTA
jgi:cell division protein FtsA